MIHSSCALRELGAFLAGSLRKLMRSRVFPFSYERPGRALRASSRRAKTFRYGVFAEIVPGLVAPAGDTPSSKSMR
jgi:hypothetical protein